MKQRKASYGIIAVLLVLSLLLSGCGGNSGNNRGQQEVPLENPISVKVTVEFPEASGKETVSSTVKVEDGAPVLDALYALAKEKDIVATIQGGDNAYVDSIDMVAEKDYGESAGWVFEVNDEMIMEGALIKTLNDGDSVVWKYKDFSETGE